LQDVHCGGSTNARLLVCIPYVFVELLKINVECALIIGVIETDNDKHTKYRFVTEVTLLI